MLYEKKIVQKPELSPELHPELLLNFTKPLDATLVILEDLYTYLSTTYKLIIYNG